MRSLDDVASGSGIYQPARILGWTMIGLMILVVVYALRIAVTNWSHIGV